jgi:hypothetical protein
MPRRYLTDTEIDQRLRSGRSVEAFLGGGVVEGQRTIRWIVLRYDSDRVQGELWEALDPRDPEWFDVYSFGTLNEEGEPSILYQFNSLQDGLTELDRQFPRISQRFVNQGVVQDEYAEYLANDA